MFIIGRYEKWSQTKIPLLCFCAIEITCPSASNGFNSNCSILVLIWFCSLLLNIYPPVWEAFMKLLHCWHKLMMGCEPDNYFTITAFHRRVVICKGKWKSLWLETIHFTVSSLLWAEGKQSYCCQSVYFCLLYR